MVAWVDTYIEEQPGGWHYGAELRESAQAKAERLIQEALRAKGLAAGQLAAWRKGHPFKLDLAMKLRRETTVTVQWIAQRLCMGARGYVAQLLQEGNTRTNNEPTQQGLGI
jgi:hypothetical protein